VTRSAVRGSPTAHRNLLPLTLPLPAHTTRNPLPLTLPLTPTRPAHATRNPLPLTLPLTLPLPPTRPAHRDPRC